MTSRFGTASISRSGRGPLRVTINASGLAPGGGLTGLVGYLRGWAEIGANMNLSVIASRPEVIETVLVTRPDVEIVPFALGVSPAMRIALARFQLGPLVAGTRPDVVMSTNFLVPGCPVPQLVHHRNFKHIVLDSPAHHLRRLDLREFSRDVASRRAIRRAQLNVFISDTMRHRAESLVPSSAPRNHVVHNGLDELFLARAADPTCSEPEQGRLISITSTAPHKDNLTLLRTLAELTRQAPEIPWRLVVAGSGEWTTEQVLAHRLGVGDRVHFAGFLGPEALDVELRKAWCAVFTSRLEAFGNAPVEAMARRCPVVAANSSAMPEVIGDAGILVLPGSARAFAAGVLSIARHETLREELVDRAVQQIQRYRWSESARRMEQLLRMTAIGREEVSPPHHPTTSQYSPV